MPEIIYSKYDWKKINKMKKYKILISLYNLLLTLILTIGPCLGMMTVLKYTQQTKIIIIKEIIIFSCVLLLYLMLNKIFEKYILLDEYIHFQKKMQKMGITKDKTVIDICEDKQFLKIYLLNSNNIKEKKIIYIDEYIKEIIDNGLNLAFMDKKIEIYM